MEFDLCVDSDNNNGLNSPDLSIAEEQAEDIAGTPGKSLFLNELDVNYNGIPDFADGYSTVADANELPASLQNASRPFVPLILRMPNVSTQYTNAHLRIQGADISDPMNDVGHWGDGTLSEPYWHWVEGAGKIRIWTRDGVLARSALAFPKGHSLPQHTWIKVSDFNPDSDGTVTLYIEAIQSSSVPGDVVVTCEYDPLGERCEDTDGHCSDTVRMTVFGVWAVHPAWALTSSARSSASATCCGRWRIVDYNA